MQDLRVLVLLLAGVRAGTALASNDQRVEFRTLVEETRVVHSEVCFFPADADDGFFKKFLSTNDVRCLSADSVISLPAGRFNVFARNGKELISTHPTFVDNSNPGEPGFRAVALSMSPAATMDVGNAQKELRPDEWLAIYLPNDTRPGSVAAVRPVSRGESTTLVPASVTIVPLVVRRETIVRVGTPMTLRTGETRALIPPSRWGSGRDVVVLLRTNALPVDDPVNAPLVELAGSASRPIQPMLPIRTGGLFERSLAIFKDVPPGPYKARLSGEGWQRDEVSVVTTGQGGAVTPARPLVGRLAAILDVHTSIGELAGLSDARCPNWPPPKADTQQVPDRAPVLRLLQCPEETNAPDSKPSCTVVREPSLDSNERERTVHWSDLVPGKYTAELAYVGMSQRSKPTDLAAGKQHSLTLSLAPDTVSGRVTRSGSPIQARVHFDHALATALSDEAGNYTIVVTPGPRRSVVKVGLCTGGTYQYLPASPIDKTLDIDVPQNSLVIRVVDEGGRPLANASVSGGPLFPEGDAEYAFLYFPATSDAGETRIDNIVTDATLRLCATHPPNYDQRCAADFTMGERSSREIEIRLRSRSTFSGKLIANAPFVGGLIWLASPTGAVLDAGYVSETGDFSLKRLNVPGAYLVVVSKTLPLTLFELRETPGSEPLKLQMPSERHAFAVEVLPTAKPRRVSLESGGHIIPTAALRTHMSLRGKKDVLATGETVTFSDLAGGPFLVYAVPYIRDYPPEWSGLDPIEQPHLRVTLPRLPVTGPLVQIE